MTRLSSKLWEDGHAHLHWCPGCKAMHQIPRHRGWTYNGNAEVPDFNPSVKHTWEYKGEKRICHYFIRNGQIQYQGDCFHELNGQSITLPDIPADEVESWGMNN